MDSNHRLYDYESCALPAELLVSTFRPYIPQAIGLFLSSVYDGFISHFINLMLHYVYKYTALYLFIQLMFAVLSGRDLGITLLRYSVQSTVEYCRLPTGEKIHLCIIGSSNLFLRLVTSLKCY